MVRALDSLVLTALTPLDGARALVLRVFAPFGRTLLRDRSARVAIQGVLGVVSALLLTACAPLLLLTLGPLLLGVPHLVADIRYLVARKEIHRRLGFWLGVAPLLAMTVVDPRFAWGSCAVAAAALTSRAKLSRRLMVVILSAGLGALFYTLGRRADVLLAYGHNLFALFAWVWWARGNKRQVVPALLLYALGALLIFSGGLEHALFRFGSLGPSAWALDAGRLPRNLSPVAHPSWALRWLLFFAFSQTVHYTVWLRIVPDEDCARPGIRSFAASYRSLVEDIGSALVLLALAAMLALVVVAFVNVSWARNGYFRLAMFHGPLEVAMAVQLLLERHKPATCP